MTLKNNRPQPAEELRRQAEEVLRESEERHKTILQTAMDGFWLADMQGRLMEVNAAYCRMSGYSEQELLAMRIPDLEVAETADDTAARIPKIMAQGEDRFETRHRCKDGSIIDVDISAQYRPTEGGRFVAFLRDITGRKRAEELLREERWRLQSIIEGTRVGTWEWNVETGETVFNEVWAQVIGYTLDELAPISIKTWETCTHPDDLKQSAKLLERHFAGELPYYDHECRMKHKDGHWVWIQDRGRVITRTGDGKPLKMFGTHTDITERKRAEAALWESEVKFAKVFRDAPVWIAITDISDATYLDVNDEALRVAGFSREEVIGHTTVEIGWIQGEDRARLVQEVQDHGRIAGLEMAFHAKDGRTLHGWVTGERVVIGGRPCLLTVTVDITERKRTEEALRESEERHRRIVEASSDAFLLRSGGFIIYANRAALKLFRANHPGELIGKRYLDVVHPDDRALSAERVKKTTDENWIAAPREHRVLALDGQVVHVESTGVPVKYRGETQIFGVFRDITERKRADQEKEKLEGQLRQAQKMEAIGTLAGGIAHDFNNILSVIIGNAEMLEFKSAVDDSSRDGMNQILFASQRAKKLVHQILAFSRHGKQEKIFLDPKPIVKETLEFLRASLPASIQLQHIIDPDSGTIMADPTQMQQVLMNLCTNAGHAMEKNGGILQIEMVNTSVTEEDAGLDPEVEPGSYVKITVSDTGHGMEPAVLQRIFDPYFTTKDPDKGTGLGLSVVHGIVKSHGGMVKANSEVGQGTTFTILLPRAMGFEKPEDRPMSRLAMGTEKILFVDDESSLVDLGRQLLGELGYQVETRTSPIEALEAFRANPQKFDLLITDMSMPQLSGLNLARKILQIRPGMPIIICTGFSEQASEQAAGALGVRAFLYKPLVMRDIADAVRKALDGT